MEASIYTEKKYSIGSVFEKRIIKDDGSTMSLLEVYIPAIQQKRDGFTYMMLFDIHGNLIQEVFQFLNVRLHKKPLTTRRQVFFALRLLYTFLSLTGSTIDYLGKDDIDRLIAFLKGNINHGLDSSLTTRSNSTINAYLVVYREFFKKNNIDCDALFEADIVLLDSDDPDQRVFRTSYKSSLPENNSNIETVRYVSPEEFALVYRIADRHKDYTAKIILQLMYVYCLRLGEVLGLTLEDVVIEKQHGEYLPILKIRNRKSDRDFQYAKEKPHILDVKDYKSSDYIKATDNVVLTNEFYETLSDYIDYMHTTMKTKYPANYDGTVSDIVSDDFQLDENHYLFLNRYGRVLSRKTWGNHLRKYFIEAGLPVDYERRSDRNLSHLFRHGGAMFLAHFSKKPMPQLELQKYLRHRKYDSTGIYYTPTLVDQLETKTNYINELYEQIPDLGREIEYV